MVKKINLQNQGLGEAAWWVGTLGDSYVDANPEQEEEDAKAHEEGHHWGDEELFVNVTCVLGGGDLVNEEPGGEEDANGQKYHRQVWEDSWADRAGVPTHGLELHFASHTINPHPDLWLLMCHSIPGEPWTNISLLQIGNQR